MSKTTKVSEEVRLALLSNGVDPDEEVVETALETVRQVFAGEP